MSYKIGEIKKHNDKLRAILKEMYENIEEVRSAWSTYIDRDKDGNEVLVGYMGEYVKDENDYGYITSKYKICIKDYTTGYYKKRGYKKGE